MIRYVYPELPDLSEISFDLQDALQTGSVTMCSQVGQFENEIAKFLDVPYALCMSNATACLMLMLRNIDGDILVPSWTFHATLAACWWNKLKPIYVDIDPKTWTIDVEDAQRKMTPNTKAILAINIFGLPPDVDDLVEFADANKIKLFFDSSQGIGSTYHGRRIGSFGDGECFSLSATKVLTTGEGGIFTTSDKYMYESMKAGRHWGDPGVSFNGGTYNPRTPGLNGHMTEFQAILGKWGLSHLDRWIEEKHKLVDIYKKYLGNHVVYQEIPPNRTTTYKDFSILVPLQKHEAVMENLLRNLIQFKNYFYPCHWTDAYKNGTSLPITEEFYYRSISLPIYNRLPEKEIKFICDVVLEML